MKLPDMSATRPSTQPSNTAAAVSRLLAPGLIAGLLGGLGMIAVMIVVMGTGGSGYASPLNLGMPGFVYAITPPRSMLPTLMGLMGIHCRPSR